VRIFPDPKTGLFQVEWRENGRRLTRLLGHRDWVRAKRQADEFAAGFASPDLNGNAEAEPEPLTLGTLFDIYGEEVTPTKSHHKRRHDRAAMRMFLRFFGRDRRPGTLSQRDWDRFIRARRAGRVGLSGAPVSNRTIAYDLKLLIAVFNWASKSRDEQGRLLLEASPLRGLKTPTEKNPTRVVLCEDEYQALLRMVRWRAEHEKTGYEHRTPVTAEAVAVLEEVRRTILGSHDDPVLPAPRNPEKCVSAVRVRIWWHRGQKLAGLEPKRGRGWHSLRRKFASDLMDQPLKVLCQLGGWKTPHTVLECYQRAAEGQLRTALDNRRRVRG